MSLLSVIDETRAFASIALSSSSFRLPMRASTATTANRRSDVTSIPSQTLSNRAASPHASAPNRNPSA